MLKVKSNLRIFLCCVTIAFICLFGYLMFQNFCSEIFYRLGWETRLTTDSLYVNGFWNAFFISAIIFPIFEELVFRLLACKLLKAIKLADWYIIVISAIIFMLYHWSWSQVAYQLLMGIWLAWIFMKTRQIGWTVLIHFINNAFIITYTYITGAGDSIFALSALNITLSISLAAVTTVAVIFLIKKGIPKYEK